MTSAANRKVGAGIAIAGAIIAASGALGHMLVPYAAAIAIIAIVLGTGVARGYFSAPPDSTKRN